MQKRLSRVRTELVSVVILFAVGMGCMPEAYTQENLPAASASGTAGVDDKDRIIADLLRRVEALERRLAMTERDAPMATQGAAQGMVQGRGAAADRATSNASPPVQPPSPSPVAAASAGPTAAANEPAEEETSRALERTLVREGGLVLPPGTFEIEPRMTYEHRSSNALQIFAIDGQAQVMRQDLKRDASEASLGFRVGLPWATQLEFALPYSVNRERRVITGSADQIDRVSGFGSAEIAITKQLVTERKGVPGLLANVTWRQAGPAEDFGNPAASDSSFRSLQGSVTAVKRQDPLVFFGSVAYAVNYSRRLNGMDINPGNTTGLKLGSILAVSPETSMRMGFEVSRSGESRVDGAKVAGSSAVAGLFTTGFSFVLSPKILLGVEGGIGLTSSAPDFRLGLSLPIRY